MTDVIQFCEKTQKTYDDKTDTDSPDGGCGDAGHRVCGVQRHIDGHSALSGERRATGGGGVFPLGGTPSSPSAHPLPGNGKLQPYIEKEHEERYRKLLANIEQGIVFSRDGDCIWQCSNCGHIVIGKKAPEVCPVCDHAQSYFQLKAENY